MAAEAGDANAMLRNALAAQTEGRLASAEEQYLAALQTLPNHFDGLHMLGVVKLQMGKFKEASQVLLAALALAPSGATLQSEGAGKLSVTQAVAGSLALSLRALANELNMLAGLVRERPADPQSTTPPFVRGITINDAAVTDLPSISVIVGGINSADALVRTLQSLQDSGSGRVDVSFLRSPPLAGQGLQRLSDQLGIAIRLLPGDGETEAAQINAAAASCTADILSFVRAGDQWTPGSLGKLVSALKQFGAPWGYAGLRIVAKDESYVRFGSGGDADRLLRALDALYQHRTPSLAFLSFNPVGLGRNLVVKRSLWDAQGGLDATSSRPFLDWAWRVAQSYEPVFLDAPAYLIPAGSETAHLQAFVDELSRSAVIGARRTKTADSGSFAQNPHLDEGLVRFWARQWRAIDVGQGFALPASILAGCAAMLDVEPMSLAPRSA